MPPYGLWPIPSQHLYKRSPAFVRPRYNSMAFDEPVEESGTAKAAVMEAAQIVNNSAEGERKDKVKDDRKARKKSSLGVAETQMTPVPVPNSTAKKSKKKPSMGVDEMPVTPVPVPAATATSAEVKKSKKKKRDKEGDDAHASKKKRKRESEVHVSSPSMVHDGHGDTDILAVSDSTEKPWTKKIKSKRKSKGDDAPDVQTHAQADADIATPQDDATKKKGKKEKKEKKRTSTQASELPFHSTPPIQEEMTVSVSPHVTTPRKTPVPLPQQSHMRTTDTHGSPNPRSDAARGTTGVLVTETTPSRLSLQVPGTRKTPVPFNPPRSTGASSGHKKARKGPTILLSPPVVQGNDLISSEASESLSQLSGDNEEPKQHPLLTSSNLLRYTQPLSDEPKPRPLRRSGSMSSASSMSIKDAFARAGKPSPKSSVEINPFFTPSSSKTRHNTPFDAAMSALRATVDFPTELAHLSKHLHIRAANDAAGPLPCLTTATGCSLKKEASIALFHTDSSLASLHASDTEQVTFTSNVSAAQTAESFLHHAVLAHIPVPIGTLEGIYTLYCPKYAATHIDKYGFGHRTLTISRPSGFTSNTYTARLHIPPRSTTFSIRAFEVPPHASFAEIGLETTAEGYGMRLVVLGNGYVVLRVDLSLLLRGRKLEYASQEEGVGMEFFGVRERDVEGRGKVEWGVMVENVKRERVRDGKEGGEGEGEEKKDGKAVKKVEVEVKKKRGRPTNVELARRAKEKAMQGFA